MGTFCFMAGVARGLLCGTWDAAETQKTEGDGRDGGLGDILGAPESSDRPSQGLRFIGGFPATRNARSAGGQGVQREK